MAIDYKEGYRLDQDYYKWLAEEVEAKRSIRPQFIKPPPVPMEAAGRTSYRVFPKYIPGEKFSSIDVPESELLDYMYRGRAETGPIPESLVREADDIGQLLGGKNAGKLKAEGIQKSRLNKIPKNLKIGALVAGAIGLSYLALSSTTSSNKKGNTIEALRHDGGLSEKVRQRHTDFGSGYQGLPKSLMGAHIDPKLLDYRANVIDVPDAFKELKDRLKRKEEETAKQIGSFKESDFERNVRLIQGLNIRNQQLRQINLEKFKINVEDADTLVLKRKGPSGLFSKDIQIRLSGIDAPEVEEHGVDPLEEIRTWQKQPGGEKATQELKDLIANQDELSLVIGGEKTYGRYVGAILGDESVLNIDLARSGAVSPLPFGSSSKDVVSREAVEAASQQAQEQQAGIWGMARYQAIRAAQAKTGQAITFNTLTRMDKMAQNLNLGAYGSFLESFGDEERNLSSEEYNIAERLGYVLRKTHGPRKRAYNKFGGLHPGSEGLGAETVRKHSDFGSGWVGNALSKLFAFGSSKVHDKNYRDYAIEKGVKLYEETYYQSKMRRIQAAQQVYGAATNKFPAMPDIGMAANMRENLTEFKKEFASRWDKFRHLAAGFLKKGTTTQEVLGAGKRLGSLGKGKFGEAFLHSAMVEGKEFKYVVKEARVPKGLPESYQKQFLDFNKKALENEYNALAEIKGDILPSAYHYDPEGAGKLYMEYMPGKSLKQLKEEGANIPSGLLRDEMEKQADTVARKGWANIDTNPGNIMYDPESGRTSWIDFGAAYRTDFNTAKEKMSTVLGSLPSIKKKVSTVAAQTLGQMADQYKGNKFAAMPDTGMASDIRESLTEFKKNFASRWDPMRKLATKLFPQMAEDAAFLRMRKLPEFTRAIESSLKGGGTALGSGGTAYVNSYAAKMAYQGQEHAFSFVGKKAWSAEALKSSSLYGKDPEFYANVFKESVQKEAKVLGHVGDGRTTSLYGMFDDTLVMEKFENAVPIKPGSLSQKEYKQLTSFMTDSHKKGITHTDLWEDNIVRTMGEGGKEEIAILDWGTSNRLARGRGIGGENANIWKEGMQELIQEESQEILGERITARKYSELSDLKRLQAHTMPNAGDVHHHGFNAPAGNVLQDARFSRQHAIESAKEVLYLERDKRSGFDISNAIKEALTPIKPRHPFEQDIVKKMKRKRMRIFRESSQAAVGSGLRSAHNGGRNHGGFRSTTG